MTVSRRRQEAVWALCNGKDFTYDIDNDIVTMINPEDVAPTTAEIDAQEIIQTQLWEDKRYARQRARAYNKLNQFELMYDDAINGTNKWQEAIDEIKARYPKPSE